MFTIVGDLVLFEGEPVATMLVGVTPTVRANVEEILDQVERAADEDDADECDVAEEIRAERERAVKFGCTMQRLVDEMLNGHAMAPNLSQMCAVVLEYMDTTGEDEDERNDTEVVRAVQEQLAAVTAERDALTAFLGVET